jgi:hypothetical protein
MSFNPGGNGFEQQGQGGSTDNEQDESTDQSNSQSDTDSERQFLSDAEQDQLRKNIQQSDSDALDEIAPGRGTLTPREGESGGAPDANAGEEDIIADTDPSTVSGLQGITPRQGTGGGEPPEGTGEEFLTEQRQQNQQQTTTPEEGAFDDGLDVDPSAITTDETGQQTTPTGSGGTEAATESPAVTTVDIPDDEIRTDDTIQTDPATGQETAQAPRGPDGDVEGAVEQALRRDRERGDIGDFAIQNPLTGNRVEEDLESASQDFSQATTFKDVPGPGGEFLSGASQAVNVPGILLGGKEAAEGGLFAARNVDKPGKVFDVATSETIATGARTSQAAQERPAETAGALTGGIVVGTAATKAARSGLPSGSRSSARSLRDSERGQLDLSGDPEPDSQTKITADDLENEAVTSNPNTPSNFGDSQTGPSVSSANFDESGRIVRQGERTDFGDDTFANDDISTTIDTTGPSSITEQRLMQVRKRLNEAFNLGTPTASGAATASPDSDLPLAEDAQDPLDASGDNTINPRFPPASLDEVGDSSRDLPVADDFGPIDDTVQTPTPTTGSGPIEIDFGLPRGDQTPGLDSGIRPDNDSDTTITPDSDTDTSITPGTDTDTTTTPGTDTDTTTTPDRDVTPTPSPSPTPTPTRPGDSDPDRPRRARLPFLDDEDDEDDDALPALSAFEEAFGSGIRDVDVEDLD